MNKTLSGLIFALFISTVYIFLLVEERQKEIENVNKFTDSWSVANLASEYFKFESWLAMYLTNSNNVTKEDIRRRLEIMLSQYNLMTEGDIGKIIKNDQENTELKNKVEIILNVLDLHFETMNKDDINDILHTMHKLDPSMSSFSARALKNDIDTINDTNIKIQKLYSAYIYISLLLIILGACTAIINVLQKNKIMKTHEKVKILAEELQISKDKLQIQNKKLEFDANHDSLTGMNNRNSFWQKIKDLVTHTQLNSGSVCVMLFDLDHFKDVNDSLGHDAGDEVLQEFAERLMSISNTREIIFRLGGDEFALITSNLAEDMAFSRAKEIRDYINQPYKIHNTIFKIETSIGIVVSDKEIRTDYLYKFADLALYEAKKEGPNSIRQFHPFMLQKMQYGISLINDLSLALENSEIKVYYQPIINSVNQAIYGYEALVRWFHPDRGLVSPDIFIPVAEQTGIINQIGQYVLKIACKEAASWEIPARISVNVSPVQLNSSEFYETVLLIINESGLPAERLELEITESTIFNNNDKPLEILIKLRALGITISIDDFGTGYSSLSRLSQISFDKIKIDKSFISTMTVHNDMLNIVKLIIGMAKNLNMKTVAEGVETEEQLSCLKLLGCDFIQGYLTGKPQPIVDEKIKGKQAI